jgi:protease I
MASKKLEGKRVAVLVDNGFEQVEMTEPVKALKEAGAEVLLISKQDRVKGWMHTDWGQEFNSDVLLEKAEPFEYDALLLPGGVMNPDKLRMDRNAVRFVKHFVETGKPVAAICHGTWTLIETKLISGMNMTSWPSLKTDLINAGVNWVDQEVVTYKGIVTSRKPGDIPAFNRKMIEEFAEGTHRKRFNADKAKDEFRSPVQGRMRENIDDRNWEEIDNKRDITNDF